MHSCLYEGRLRHRRFAPAENAFEYALFMLYLDLAELPSLFDGHLLWSSGRPNVACFNRARHLGDPDRPLEDCVRDLVERDTGTRPSGPIRLLTHLTYFGYGFNPVSFYYCFDADGREVETVVSEVNNTPWGEQHVYVLPESMNASASARKLYRFRKQFHVSPFMGMDQDYVWRFTAPGRGLTVHMDNLETGVCLFDSTLVLRRTEITSGSLARVLIQYPLMTAKVIGTIHWQALKLWLKRCPFYPHPRFQDTKMEAL
jgi:uncharacterized protein